MKTCQPIGASSKKKIMLCAVFAVMSSLMVAGPASAAHCVASATNPTTPGFSYFGTDHVKETDHSLDGGPDAEGGNPGPHMGTSGASNCRDTTGSPSDRAPGQNR